MAPDLFPDDVRTVYSGTPGDYITSLAVNPVNSSEVLLTVQRNATGVVPITFSPTYTANIALMELYKSTDNGSTWTKLNTPMYYSGTGQYPLASLVRYAPSDPNTLYMDGAHYRSTDGGNTWTDISLPQAIHINSGALAIHPQNSTTLIAAVGTTTHAAAAKSTDGGSTWTTIGSGFPDGWTVDALSFDPTNSNTVYMAGWVYPDQYTRFYRSDDGGNTWIRKGDLGTGVPTQIEVTSSGTLYVNGNFGLMKSTDGGSTWTKKSAVGIGTGHYPGMILDSSTIYNASYDVYRVTNAGSTWTKINGNLPTINANKQSDVWNLAKTGNYLLAGTFWHGVMRLDLSTCP